MSGLRCGGGPVGPNVLWRSAIRNPIQMSVAWQVTVCLRQACLSLKGFFVQSP
ncbi:hypothetical protein ACFPN7_06585 [Amycolatopsis halotolerans]|uniref:hypothetical protein n=1 Tax=Amycolatopsis halotolerans TaxID=330083 RepID=UPI0036084B77